MAHNIVHFEIPADDVERARKFYEGLFGWQIAPAPGQPEGGDQYYMIQIEEGATALLGALAGRLREVKPTTPAAPGRENVA